MPLGDFTKQPTYFIHSWASREANQQKSKGAAGSNHDDPPRYDFAPFNSFVSLRQNTKNMITRSIIQLQRWSHHPHQPNEPFLLGKTNNDNHLACFLWPSQARHPHVSKMSPRHPSCHAWKGLRTHFLKRYMGKCNCRGTWSPEMR